MKKKDTLSERFLWRLRRRMLIDNKNWLAIVCGETGSGKSYSALSIADTLCPRGITIRRNVVFNPVQFLQRVTHHEDLKKGDIIIFDESGVGLSAREWYSIQNRLLGSVLQTFRNLNIGCIFTTPNLGFMDVQGRKLLHHYFETAGINYEEELAYLKVYVVQHNSRLDKTYYKLPALVDGHGKVIKVQYLAIPKPRPELVADYETAKTEYTRALNARALEELTTPRERMNRKTDFAEENRIVASIKQNPKPYLRRRGQHQILDHGKIMADYHISVSQTSRIKRRVETELKLLDG